MEGPCDAKDGTAPGEDHQTAVNNVTYYGGDDGDTGENEGLVSEHEEDAEQDAVSKQLFMVDYCKRGNTKCRRCRKKIPVAELRIGKPVKFKTKNIYHYFHVKCAFESFEKARSPRNIIPSPAWTT